MLFALFLGFFLWSLSSAGISIGESIEGLPNIARIGAEMVPPATGRSRDRIPIRRLPPRSRRCTHA
jgi:phosphonate transport system permease protein